MSKRLPCLTIKKSDSSLVEIRSPYVGRAKLLVGLGQTVVGGQIIADFFRLNRRDALTLPEGTNGRITHIENSDRVISLGYNQLIFTVDTNSFIGEETRSHSIADVDKVLGTSFVESPMDGMFYSSSSPDSPPFVAVGEVVKPGQTLGLIEVMKCFYPLKYEGKKTAKILDACCKNGTPVNCGTKLYSVTEI